MAGRFFDEWQVGDIIAHAITRTVTETDNVLVSALTHNPQPMHLDHEVAAASEFGKPLVNSIYTFGLMVGVSVSDTTLGTLVANLGYDKLVFPAPVFVGDTLRSESECLAVGGDAILEVEDDRVGVAVERLLNLLVAVGGDEQPAARWHQRHAGFFLSNAERVHSQTFSPR